MKGVWWKPFIVPFICDVMLLVFLMFHSSSSKFHGSLLDFSINKPKLGVLGPSFAKTKGKIKKSRF
jgi:hypothetical protein